MIAPVRRAAEALLRVLTLATAHAPGSASTTLHRQMQALRDTGQRMTFSMLNPYGFDRRSSALCDGSETFKPARPGFRVLRDGQVQIDGIFGQGTTVTLCLPLRAGCQRRPDLWPEQPDAARAGRLQ